MGKFLNSFLEFKNEADATRKFALFAVVIITLGLASLSVTGIVATAHWSWLSFLPTLGMIIAVLGAELLATVAFIRTLTASTKLRKVAGAFIFLGLAAVGVHNAENGAKVVWPDRFAESSSSLAAKAALAGEEAGTLGEAQQAAIASTGGELERVRTDIAKLEAERTMLSNQSPEGIQKAQSHLQAMGLYFGREDGISDIKTESARRLRGEQIASEMAVLKARENGLLSGQASPVQQATTDKRLLQIQQADAANAAFWAWAWLIIMLCTLEGARSLSLWALITDISSRDAQRDREWTDELAALRHQQERARIIAETNAAVAAYSAPPAPVEAPPAPAPEPAPIPEPEPMVLDTPAPLDEPVKPPPGRTGGLSTQHINRASSIEDVILVEDNRARNAERDSERLVA